MKFERQKLLRAWRLVISLLITFLITWYFEIPERMWALITCCFVIFEFTTFGGVFNKSWMRFFSTLSSAIYSIIIVYFFGNNAIINWIALVIGIFVYSYLFLDKKEVYMSVLGCVTLTLTLLNFNQIEALALRPFNIGLGIIVAFFTFRFVCPEYARDKIMEVQADFIAHLCQIIEDFLDNTKSLKTVQESYLQHEKNLLNDMTAFNRNLDEAKMETKKAPSFTHCNTAAFVHIKRVYRLISVLIYHLATEEIRADAYLRAGLQEVISSFQTIRDRILHPEINQLINNNDISWNNEPLDTDNKALLVKALLDGIVHQMALFEKELNTILMIRLNKYRECDV